MYITVNVELIENDSFAYTPDAAASQVLAALGGNPTKDGCTVHVLSTTDPGQAGVPPPGQTPATAPPA